MIRSFVNYVYSAYKILFVIKRMRIFATTISKESCTIWGLTGFDSGQKW